MKIFPGRITADSETCGGRPFFRGTRIPVYVVLEMLAHGENRKDIFTNYPDLRAKDLKDALSYARNIAELPVTPIRAA